MIELPPRSSDPNRRQFSILDFVQQPRRKASGNYYTSVRPVAQVGHDRASDNLAISISDSRKYKCWGRLYERSDSCGCWPANSDPKTVSKQCSRLRKVRPGL
jgi:hypothetical protein